MNGSVVKKYKVLLVEDNKDLAELLRWQLDLMGCTVDIVEDGGAGLTRALSQGYDLHIFDVMLPTLDGFEVCRRLRKERPASIIVMLTSRSEEIDKVTGLDLGADDYITKPFQLAELLARIRALLRRAELAGTATTEVELFSTPLVYDNLSIDLERRRVLLNGNPVELTPREFDLLAFLARHSGRPFRRDVLLETIWGETSAVYEFSINSLVARLRKKIEIDPNNPRFIRTVRGVGYRFVEKDELS